MPFIHTNTQMRKCLCGETITFPKNQHTSILNFHNFFCTDARMFKYPCYSMVFFHKSRDFHLKFFYLDSPLNFIFLPLQITSHIYCYSFCFMCDLYSCTLIRTPCDTSIAKFILNNCHLKYTIFLNHFDLRFSLRSP